MQLEYISDFLTLYKHKNYHKAAEEIGISQPALTKHIKALEEEFGVSLFDRNTRNVVLSEYGEVLLPFAERYMRLEYDCIQAIRQKQYGEIETLTIAAAPSAAEYGLTEVLTQFKKENPDVLIELLDISVHRMKPLLKYGRCQFIFIHQDTREDSEFETFPFSSDRLVVVFPNSHPLARRESVDIRQLNSERLFSPPESTIQYQLFAKACRSAGFEPNVNIMGAPGLIMLKMIEAGNGVALMAKIPATRRSAAENLSFVNINPEIKLYQNMLYINQADMSPVAGRFLAFITQFHQPTSL